MYCNTIAPVDVTAVGVNGSCELRSSPAGLYNTALACLCLYVSLNGRPATETLLTRKSAIRDWYASISLTSTLRVAVVRRGATFACTTLETERGTHLG